MAEQEKQIRRWNRCNIDQSLYFVPYQDLVGMMNSRTQLIRSFVEEKKMNRKKAVWAMLLALLTFVPAGRSQDATQPKKAVKPATTSPAAANQKTNIQAYIQLLRSDVRQQKAEIMGSVMQLSAADAAKFWPIYTEYDTELAKLNDQRMANIHDYALNYSQMTDAKADELIQNAMAYQKQRGELVAKYYDRVKQELGAITAARFVQIEHQLLSIIDLRIAAELPIVGAGS
ncbi:MAG TPA: hypothetical protein VJW94_02465 [Candidatus Acidoferrum sp.]|nr:hypothetical protein [Candidatus Acidoferrum sp.]